MHIEKRKSGLLVPTQQKIGEAVMSRGVYKLQHIRDGKVIDEEILKNLVVDQGLNYLLSVSLAAGSQLSSWYLGIFEGNYTPVPTDTAATIAANSTECSAYAGGARKPWTPGAVASKSVSNSASRGDFVFNATKTIYGAFLISNATINGTSGTLFSAARFATSKAVVNNDELLLTYTFNASSA